MPINKIKNIHSQLLQPPSPLLVQHRPHQLLLGFFFLTEKVTILSTNRDLEENVKQGAKMLTVDLKKIPFYQDGLKDGI